MPNLDGATTHQLLSVSQWSLPKTSFEEDVALLSAAGLRGIHVGEKKIPSGETGRLLSMAQEAGLRITGVISETLSILPAHSEFGGRDKPAERIDDLCAGVERLGPYGPDSFLVVTGAPGPLPAGEARRIVIDGLSRICASAAGYGVNVVVEPMRQDFPVKTSIIETLPQALELIAEVDADNLKVCFDFWHLWDTPDILRLAEQYATAVGSVHLCDRPAHVRGSKDRMLPGDGVLDLAGLVGALHRGGYRGWYHLFVASDERFEDSPWRLAPEDFISRGVRGFGDVVTRISQPAEKEM
jgi:sugar phosphate isomerase/epimerase